MNVCLRQLLSFSLLVTVFHSGQVIAQSKDPEFQTWTDFATFMFLSNRSAVGGDAGFRGIASAKEWSQFYLRPTYRYQFNTLDLAGGFAFFQTYNQEISNVTEWRLFQQATLHWPNTHLIKFSHRLRIEQRFLHYKDPVGDQQENEFFNRIRYQFMLRTRDLSLFQQKVYFKAATEIFQKQNAGNERFINRNRLVFAAGHRLPGKWWYELHYIAQLSRQYQDDGLRTSEHIFRIRLFRAAKFRHRIE
jgi:hypothetical protein